MCKLLFAVIFVAGVQTWAQEDFDESASAVSADETAREEQFTLGGRGLPMEQAQYRALFPNRFAPDCDHYQRVYADGSCETDRWINTGDSSRYFWSGGGEFEMRCRREQMDRDADIVGSSGNIVSRTVYKEVVVRFRENAQRNRDDARRNYIEMEIDGRPQRVEVSRPFRFEDCNISRGPRPERQGPACSPGDNVAGCLLRQVEVVPVEKNDHYGLEATIQF